MGKDFLDVKAIIETKNDNFRVWIVCGLGPRKNQVIIKEVYAKYDPIDYDVYLTEDWYNEIRYNDFIEIIFDEKEKMKLILTYANK